MSESAKKRSSNTRGSKKASGGDSGRSPKKTTTTTIAPAAEVKKRKPTHSLFKRTHEEALACESAVPLYELYDLETGAIKEEYLRARSPPPPTGTTVYEVGTGRPYTYVAGNDKLQLCQGSMLMVELREKARLARAASGVTVTTSAIAGPSRVESTPLAFGSSLHRVIPSPMDSSQKSTPFLRPPTSPQLPPSPPSARTKELATEKVMRWRTYTPEPLESQTHDLLEDAVAAASGSTGIVDFDMCGCVVLLTSDNVSIDTKKPDMADAEHQTDPVETGRLLEGSKTLRYLWAGYRSYVENSVSADTHCLSAYSCRSIRHGVYGVHKTIRCRSKESFVARKEMTIQSGAATTTTTTTTVASTSATTVTSGGSGGETRPRSDLYKSLLNINQYLNVFSALADFEYTLLSSGQGGSACNVMVVDKVWTYNPKRRIFLPNFHLLEGDSYTELMVNDMRRLNTRMGRVDSLRFISTPNTLLYTNRLALSRRGRDTLSARRTRTSGGGESLPIKKRRIDLDAMTEVVADTSGITTTGGARRAVEESRYRPTSDFVLRMKGWPSCEHRPSCDRLMSSADREEPTTSGPETSHTSRHERTEARNPTLVIFKQSISDKEPNTLMCYIMVEVHLGHEIQY